MRDSLVAATVLVLVTVVVVGPTAVTVGGTGAAGEAPGPPAAAMSTDADENASPGAYLAGAVGSGQRSTAAAVERRAYASRLAAAEGDGELARVVGVRLTATAERVSALERRRAALDRTRENGSRTDGAYTARAARLAAEARGLRRIVNRSETAVESLPEGSSERRNLSRRAGALDDRLDALLDADLRAAATAVSGENVPGRTGPLTLADVVAAYEAAAGGAPGEFQGLFGRERVTVAVRRADGSVAEFGLVTRNGRVVEAHRGAVSSPTLRVYAHHTAVREIRRSDHPWQTAQRALDRDRLDYDGVGVLNGLKFGLAALLQALARLIEWLLGVVASAVALRAGVRTAP